MPADSSLRLLNQILPRLQREFAALPPYAPEENYAGADERMAAVLAGISGRMADNFPYFHPLYAGQMMKPPHPIARAAYAMAMWINPNNHSLDGGRASSRFEVESVREIAGMFGWRQYLGHLTSGGTVANLEALWVAGQLAPGKRVVASAQAHYTHSRISGVLGIGFTAIATDIRGCMDVAALREELAGGDVGTVVVTLGTTAVGSVDPLDRVLDLRREYGFRIHVDAAYGGYFKLVANLDRDAAQAFACMEEADSIVVDPHKHGLQPYGCGCVIFRDPSVGHFYKHDSPYTYFSSEDLHLGEISLECSRAGAAAVALWATQRLLPLVKDGEFARSLAKCRAAALRMHELILGDERFIAPFAPEMDILVWAVRGQSLNESSRIAQKIFAEAAKRDLHLALAQIPVRFFPGGTWLEAGLDDTVTCLRSVLMKPEHLDWVDRIWERLMAATDAAVHETTLREAR